MTRHAERKYRFNDSPFFDENLKRLGNIKNIFSSKTAYQRAADGLRLKWFRSLCIFIGREYDEATLERSAKAFWTQPETINLAASIIDLQLDLEDAKTRAMLLEKGLIKRGIDFFSKLSFGMEMSESCLCIPSEHKAFVLSICDKNSIFLCGYGKPKFVERKKVKEFMPVTSHGIFFKVHPEIAIRRHPNFRNEVIPFLAYYPIDYSTLDLSDSDDFSRRDDGTFKNQKELMASTARQPSRAHHFRDDDESGQFDEDVSMVLSGLEEYNIRKLFKDHHATVIKEQVDQTVREHIQYDESDVLYLGKFMHDVSDRVTRILGNRYKNPFYDCLSITQFQRVISFRNRTSPADFSKEGTLGIFKFIQYACNYPLAKVINWHDTGQKNVDNFNFYPANFGIFCKEPSEYAYGSFPSKRRPDTITIDDKVTQEKRLYGAEAVTFLLYNTWLFSKGKSAKSPKQFIKFGKSTMMSQNKAVFDRYKILFYSPNMLVPYSNIDYKVFGNVLGESATVWGEYLKKLGAPNDWRQQSIFISMHERSLGVMDDRLTIVDLHEDQYQSGSDQVSYFSSISPDYCKLYDAGEDQILNVYSLILMGCFQASDSALVAAFELMSNFTPRQLESLRGLLISEKLPMDLFQRFTNEKARKTSAFRTQELIETANNLLESKGEFISLEIRAFATGLFLSINNRAVNMDTPATKTDVFVPISIAQPDGEAVETPIEITTIPEASELSEEAQKRVDDAATLAELDLDLEAIEDLIDEL